ncbi:hypothetical protein NP493_5g05013 [Ridgeia piscesae]|uniref:Uncharacterized protein n=1 Tax=Ridgeia piscesae TaxID=27915 RepID=A0AAD9PFD1_RIDPI|nr:hypothetical protein NP493_3250g00000 [Ridgeia piscesae]KAK2193792.1 hypothetical protein NP493_5g05013 [Ridgeia piscesae]
MSDMLQIPLFAPRCHNKYTHSFRFPDL